MARCGVTSINLQGRISVKSIKALALLFKGNPRKYTAVEIAKESGISSRSARELLFVYERRPDLIEQVFIDEISLYRAGQITRAEPDSWKPLKRTRF